MNISVNIDDETFGKLISKGIDLLDDNEIKDITTNAIKSYMEENKNNVMEKAFFSEKKNYYGGNEYEPTYFLKELVNNLNYPDLQDMVDECTKYLEDNYKNIIEKMILSLIIKGLTDNCDFRSALENVVRDIMIKRSN